MNQTAMARIAAAVSSLRPEWPASSVLTTITKNLADRPYRDVAVALAWVAADETSKTPARVLGNGPWWVAASGGASDSAATPTAPKLSALRCDRCGGIKPEGDEVHAAICARRSGPTEEYQQMRAAGMAPTVTFKAEDGETS